MTFFLPAGGAVALRTLSRPVIYFFSPPGFSTSDFRFLISRSISPPPSPTPPKFDFLYHQKNISPKIAGMSDQDDPFVVDCDEISVRNSLPVTSLLPLLFELGPIL